MPWDSSVYEQELFLQVPAVTILPSDITSLTKSWFYYSSLKHYVKYLYYVKIDMWKYIQYDHKLVSKCLLELML